jgi:Carboxypeptidase regulatory-like domain
MDIHGNTGIVAVVFLFAGALAQAATISGTVTDKTTAKPAVGDAVVLLDARAGMGEVARATTNAKGHYTLTERGIGPYLIRVTHQGAGYIIVAPQGGEPGDIPVYDVAAKVGGVRIEADVVEGESNNGQLNIDERYFVHNTSMPPTTQWSKHSFSIVLPAEATVGQVGVLRPNGLPTSAKLDPDGPKGHYSFNFPIRPDEGDRGTTFLVSYTLPYSGGKFTFKSLESLPADNVAVILPKTMSFAGGSGASFNAVNADPVVQTFLAKNVAADKPVAFTISGTGTFPRAAQSSVQTKPQGNQAGAKPIIDTPSQLSKYKWWILGGLGLLLLATATVFLLRRPKAALAGAPGVSVPVGDAVPVFRAPAPLPATKSAASLNVLKDELFALESERHSETISLAEYAEAKAALEMVLKRALKKSS